MLINTIRIIEKCEREREEGREGGRGGRKSVDGDRGRKRERTSFSISSFICCPLSLSLSLSPLVLNWLFSVVLRRLEQVL